MNINTRDLDFIKFNGQEMAFVNFNNQTIYEAWKKLMLNGVSPLTLPKCKNTKLINYKIEGNSISKSKLPKEYQELEYIQTTGTQYINSGIPLKNGLKMIVDWIFNDADGGNSYTGGHIGSPGNRWLVGSQRQNNYCFAVGASNVVTEFAFGNRDVVEAYWENQNSYFICNGVASTKYNYKIYTLTEEPDYTFYLGAVDRDGNATLRPKLTIYNWKFYQDDVLIRDYVPCYRKSDNVAGLYDLVNDVFYMNDGTGEFIKGGVIYDTVVESVGSVALPEDYQQVEYIETTGTQYIDTNFHPDSNSSIEIDVLMKDENYSSDKNGFIFGVTNSGYTKRFSVNLFYSNNRKILEAYPRFSTNAPAGGHEDVKPINLEQWYNIRLDKGTYYIDNTLWASYSNTFEKNEHSLYISGYNDCGSVRLDYTAISRIKKCKIWDNSILARHFIPCYRKSDNVIGMYDLINDDFYINAGTGEFIKGNDIDTYKIPIKVTPTIYDFNLEKIGKMAYTTDGDTRFGFDLGVLEVGQYTFDFNFIQHPNYIYLRIKRTNGVFDTIYITTNANEKPKTPITFTSDGVSNFYVIFASSSVNNKSKAEALWNNVTSAYLQKASNIQSETVGIYTKEPLRKNENYIDYTDYEKQKVFRNIMNTTFDGTENWEVHTAINGGNVFRLDNVLNPLINAPLSATYMSHFSLTNIYSTANFNVGVYRFSSGQEVDKITGTRLYVSTEHETLEEFKVWLSENKPSVTYPIEVTEESIDLPDITLNKGTNIIEVDTTIKPSNMEVTYLGKK